MIYFQKGYVGFLFRSPNQPKQSSLLLTHKLFCPQSHLVYFNNCPFVAIVAFSVHIKCYLKECASFFFCLQVKIGLGVSRGFAPGPNMKVSPGIHHVLYGGPQDPTTSGKRHVWWSFVLFHFFTSVSSSEGLLPVKRNIVSLVERL